MIRKNLAVLTAALFAASAPLSVFAAVPPGIDTGFATAGTDAATVVGYIAVALIVFVGAMWVVKAIRAGK